MSATPPPDGDRQLSPGMMVLVFVIGFVVMLACGIFMAADGIVNT